MFTMDTSKEEAIKGTFHFLHSIFTYLVKSNVQVVAEEN
jgi:hypothetical protein